MSLRRRYTATRFQEQVIESLLFLCALVSIATTLGIVVVMLSESVFSLTGGKAFFQEISPWEFFGSTKWSPQFADKHFGVLPLLCGTILVAGIAAVTGLPIGMLAAIYLSEYAAPKVRRMVKPFLEILAGIPTVVYGYFALEFITPYVLRPFFQGMLGFDVDGFNALSAGLVVGIMIIPMVCSLSEDALRAVPRSLREAGYALGSTKYDVCVRVVVPAATSGIIASFLLAISRAIGETMAVVIAAGQSPVITLNPLKSIQTMTAFMVNISLGDTPAGSIEYKSLYAVGLTLFCITLLMNVLSQWWMHRFREVYQ
ncbi:phosphate ABC transporter permease subunit PstC [Planctomicrobium piriforme]|uniref:phosphate ABC transporter permease subunit PstC n=1 Tax=Planctomicrobium piriforme TaxID=1576369 RepID=UPI001C319F42|nr:phosphate ABC transporter permease subunit PstC [Planctomicrobium piriforme]